MNVRDDDQDSQWRLFIGCLIAAFRPIGPYPILALNGEHGSAKSTSAKIHRRLSMLMPSATGQSRTARFGRAPGRVEARSAQMKISTRFSSRSSASPKTRFEMSMPPGR